MKYYVEIELPDNEIISEDIKITPITWYYKQEVKWQVCKWLIRKLKAMITPQSNTYASDTVANCCDWINKDNDSSGMSQTMYTTLISES